MSGVRRAHVVGWSIFVTLVIILTTQDHGAELVSSVDVSVASMGLCILVVVRMIRIQLPPVRRQTRLERSLYSQKLRWRIKSKVGYLWSSGEHFMSKSQLFLQFQLNLNIILHLEIILLKYSSNKKMKILVKAVSRKFFRMMCSNIYVNNSVVIQSLWFDILLRKVDNSLQNFVISKIVVFKLYENHNPSMQLCLTGIMRVEDRHYLHQDIYKRHCIW